MRRIVVLAALLAACGSKKSLKDQVVGTCGNPPTMSGAAMQEGLPWDNGPDKLIAVDPRDYQAMLAWRDCIGSH